MSKYFGCALAMAIAAICSFVTDPAFGQAQLLAGFENTLNSTAGGVPFTGLFAQPGEYTTVGATEGTKALVLRHTPVWETNGATLKAGLPLAQQVASHDFMQFDLTTMDNGIAGDGWAPNWRQLFAIFNSNEGGWQQNQI